jgi:hypothetical protein
LRGTVIVSDTRCMTSYRVHGMTDDTDTCEHCGKEDLRRVVMLAALDADGNTEEIIHVGTTCASRLLARRGTRTTAAKVRDAADAAGRGMAQARAFADEFAPLTLSQFTTANATGLLNVTGGDSTTALALAKVRYAELQTEITAIRAGDLAATRFAAKLPTIGA